MSLPIVGAHFRPPAKAILAILPAGTPLSAVPEPENAYDENAIAIFVKTSDIPQTAEALAAFDAAAAGYGMDHTMLLADPAWHLGYIPAKIAVFLAPKMVGETYEGSFVLDPTGKPKIKLPLEETIAHLID